VIILLTQKPVWIVTSQLKRIKATPSGRCATLTRLSWRAHILLGGRLFEAVKVRASDREAVTLTALNRRQHNH
jgi:hypothetical protein